MELAESVKSINRQLIDEFGVDTLTGLPIWRIVWSEDQTEKRLMNTTDSGIQLLHSEVREVKKYSQWIIERYVLERLTLVPEANESELPSQKLSYEPMWTFEDKHGNYLPPKFEAAKFVVDTIYAVQGKSSLAKYKEGDEEEEKEKRVNEIQEYLFGDETDISDALARGEGVSLYTPKEN